MEPTYFLKSYVTYWVDELSAMRVETETFAFGHVTVINGELWLHTAA